MDLSDRKVVIFGGGDVGERKARFFSEHARVTVASQEFSPGLLEMAKEGSIKIVRVSLPQGADDLLRGAFIAIPATSDPALNVTLEERAREFGILVNRVDGVGEVVVPSVIRRDPVVVAISTFGASPALSKHLRMRLEEVLDEGYADMARLLGEMRGVLKERVSEQAERKRILWEIISDEEVWRLISVSYEKAYKKAEVHIAPEFTSASQKGLRERHS